MNNGCAASEGGGQKKSLHAQESAESSLASSASKATGTGEVTKAEMAEVNQVRKVKVKVQRESANGKSWRVAGQAEA